MSERLAIFGGTFDPIHYGHLALAAEVCWELDVQKVFFVPAAQQPFKGEGHAAPAGARLEMVRLATEDSSSFTVCDLEIRRGGRSYTVDTVADLREEFPGADFTFVAGADVLEDLHRWYAIERLLALCRFAVVTRPGYPIDLQRLYTLLPAARDRITTIAGLALDISATDLRNRLRRGAPVRFQMPDAVIDYIHAHGLYGTRA